MISMINISVSKQEDYLIPDTLYSYTFITKNTKLLYFEDLNNTNTADYTDFLQTKLNYVIF